MKKVLFAMVLTLVLAGIASAQGPKINFYAGGGMALPMGPDDFKDYWKSGISFGGGVGFQQSANMELKAMLFYNKFDVDEDGMIEEIEEAYGIDASGLEIDGGEMTAIEIMGVFKYSLGLPEAPARPYLLGSVGITAMKVAEATISYGSEYGSETTPETTESKLSFGVGGGVDIKIGATTALFAEAQYMYVSTEGDAITYLPIRGGIKFTFGQ
ncbi:MAG TPA: outer membrane beta-barrel protein [candidate division Zixibacteria bacterium]|nr:outer membrane beta-barrel protein [candidate division Zixibacteria bacterium]